jgi:uncharacterized protein YndB with AHSA1/START domain
MDNEIINNPDQEGWIKKSIEINASDDKVWNTLTTRELIKKWAIAFEEGTVVESDWTEGAIVTWKNAEGRNLIKGKVEVSYPSKLLKLRYFDDENAADDAATGEYQEHYLLSEQEGKTTFTVDSGPLSDHYIKSLDPQWDRALKLIKQLAEGQ